MSVTYSKPIGFDVGEFLIEQGFYLANMDGKALDGPRNCYSYGLLVDDRPQTFWCFGLIPCRKRKSYVGLLSMMTNDHWRLDVYGIEYRDMCINIGKMLSDTFNRPVHVVLQSKTSYVETFFGELD